MYLSLFKGLSLLPPMAPQVHSRYSVDIYWKNAFKNAINNYRVSDEWFLIFRLKLKGWVYSLKIQLWPFSDTFPKSGQFQVAFWSYYLVGMWVLNAYLCFHKEESISRWKGMHTISPDSFLEEEEWLSWWWERAQGPAVTLGFIFRTCLLAKVYLVIFFYRESLVPRPGVELGVSWKGHYILISL